MAQSNIQPVLTIHKSMNDDEDASKLVSKVFAANQEVIRSTLSTIDFAAVQKAVEHLSRAEKIVFHGVAGSAAVAMDAYRKFLRIGMHCECYSDTHMAIMAGAMMKPGQVFVVIAHSESAHDLVESVQTAKNTGVTTIGIVGYGVSPLSKVVTHALTVGPSEAGFGLESMTSRIAQLCVIDVLSVGVSLLRRESSSPT